MAPSSKAAKEDFVSGLTGGTVAEINLVTAVAPVGHEITSYGLLSGCIFGLVNFAHST